MSSEAEYSNFEEEGWVDRLLSEESNNPDALNKLADFVIDQDFRIYPSVVSVLEDDNLDTLHKYSLILTIRELAESDECALAFCSPAGEIFKRNYQYGDCKMSSDRVGERPPEAAAYDRLEEDKTQKILALLTLGTGALVSSYIVPILAKRVFVGQELLTGDLKQSMAEVAITVAGILLVKTGIDDLKRT